MSIDVAGSTVIASRPAALRRRLPTMLGVALLAGGLAWGGLRLMPPSYEAAATLGVEPSGQGALIGAAGAGAGLDILIEAQMQAVMAPDLLLQVADGLALTAREELQPAAMPGLGWLFGAPGSDSDLDQALVVALAERISVERIGSEPAFALRFRGESPERAAELANRMAEALIRERSRTLLVAVRAEAQRLQAEVAAQREAVQAAEDAVAAFRLDQGLFEGLDAATLAEPRTSGLASRIVEAQQREASARGRADALRRMVANGDPLDGLTEVQQSAVLQRQLRARAELDAELTDRSTTLLGNHPTIRALKSQIAAVDAQIAAEARKIAASLEADAEAAAVLGQRLRDELARSRQQPAAGAGAAVTLEGLELEARLQRDLLDGYLVRQAQLNTTIVQPDLAILERAEPPAASTRGPDWLIAGLIALAALLFQSALLLLRDLAPRQVRGEDAAVAPQDPDFLPAQFEADLDHELTEDEPVVVLPQPQGPARDDLAPVLAAVVARRLRTVLLASVDGSEAVGIVAERLLEEGLAAGLSVVFVDAGSGVPSRVAGLSDLAAEQIGYGDVVQRVTPTLGEVAWGRQPRIDSQSSRPLTLVEALSDLYQLVVVDTGRVSGASSLPLFCGGYAPVLLVAEAGVPPVGVAAARRVVTLHGLVVERVVTVPVARAEVA